MTSPIRVLLADDHRIVLEGLCRLLRDEVDVVGVAEDGQTLVDKAKQLHPDVIVSDISMPILNGFQAARRLREEGVESGIVFLTMHEDSNHVEKAFESGARGFVPKHSAPTELIHAIQEVYENREYRSTTSTAPITGESPAPPPPSRTLTPRQEEVLRLLASGSSAKEVAAALKISPRTAEFHKYRMMEALQIRTTAELIQYAVRNGFVSAS